MRELPPALVVFIWQARMLLPLAAWAELVRLRGLAEPRVDGIVDAIAHAGGADRQRGATLGNRTEARGEIRNPKTEGRPKSEIRNPNGGRLVPFRFRASDFLRSSVFGSRIFPRPRPLPHRSRSRPLNHENQRGPDLNFNLPNPNTLGNLSPQKLNGQHELNRPASAVVTWMAPQPRPAKWFGSRSSQGAERRKAMET